MKKIFASVASAFLPLVAFAQNTINTTWIDSVVTFVQNTINLLFPIATGIMVLVFFYEIYKFISAEPAKKDEARKGLFWSIFGLFLVFAIFGIIGLLLRITGTANQNQVNGSQLPTINFNQ